MPGGGERILPCVLTSLLCLWALRLAGTTAPFISKPDVLFLMWSRKRTGTPTEVTQPSPMEGVHTTLSALGS